LEDAVAREEDAAVKVKLKINSIVGIGTNDKLGRKHTLGFHQLPFQIRILFLSNTDFIRLVQGNTALQGDVLVKLIVQRLFFL
jgi:hypothetical protein